MHAYRWLSIHLPWVRLMCSCVCCLSEVLCAVMFRLVASCYLPVMFAPCASPSQCVRALGGGQAEPFFGMIIVTIIIAYNYRYYIMSAKSILLSYFIYYSRSTTFELLIVTYWTVYFSHIQLLS